MSFCKDFNAKTSEFMADVPIPVVLTAFKDKTFEWSMTSPPASYFIKKAAGITQGAQKPGHGSHAKISLKHIYHIAELKQKDKGFAYMPLKSLCQSIMSTAKSMGVEVVR